MKVILLQDVLKIGKKGDVLNAAEGYARNYLIPRGLASEATPGKMKELAQVKAVQDRKQQHIEAEARALAQKLSDVKVTVKTKTGEGGRLFGAVSSKDITDALLEQHNITVDKKKLALKEPIKVLGDYPVTVKVHPGIQAEITVTVVAAAN